MPLLVDTDVLIDYLRDHPDAVAYLDAVSDRLLISAMTIFGNRQSKIGNLFIPRSVESALPPARSIQSDDSRQRLSRCRRESTRERESGRSSLDRFGTFRYRQKPDAGRLNRAGRSE